MAVLLVISVLCISHCNCEEGFLKAFTIPKKETKTKIISDPEITSSIVHHSLGRLA